MLHRVKKHNDINEGKWIGVGGHAEDQESPEECLLREVKEETGLTLTSYKLRGLVTFICDKCEPELMCVFTANEYIGELTECNEGELYWMSYMPDNFPKSLTAVYPILYNYSYLLAEGIITVIIISVPAVSKALTQVKRAALQ